MGWLLLKVPEEQKLILKFEFKKIRVEEASHDNNNQVLKERQASHDDVGNPLICWLHSQPARNFAYFGLWGIL